MNTFAALADPTRRKIIETLSQAERSVNDIADDFSMSKPAISQHLKVLRHAQLVKVRVEAQRRIYTLDPAGLSELDSWLNSIRHFWKNRLDDLERELKQPPPDTTRSK